MGFGVVCGGLAAVAEGGAARWSGAGKLRQEMEWGKMGKIWAAARRCLSREGKGREGGGGFHLGPPEKKREAATEALNSVDAGDERARGGLEVGMGMMVSRRVGFYSWGEGGGEQGAAMCAATHGWQPWKTPEGGKVAARWRWRGAP